MELRTLEYFLVVAREESITRAARLLHMTQPTLSRQMKQLEDELGVSLFTRTSHNSLLTEEGLLLKKRAEELLALAEKTKSDMKHTTSELIGEISIGCGEFQSSTDVRAIMKSFMSNHPQVTVRLYTGDADTITEKFDKGLLDFCLVMDGINPEIYDFSVMPSQEEWGIYVTPDNPLAQKEYVVPEDFESQWLYISGRTTVRERIAAWMGEKYTALRIRGSGDLMYNLAMMIDRPDEIAVGIRLHCDYKGLRFIPLYPTLTFSTVLAWKKQPAYSALMQTAIAHIESYTSRIS